MSTIHRPAQINAVSFAIAVAAAVLAGLVLALAFAVLHDPSSIGDNGPTVAPGQVAAPHRWHPGPACFAVRPHEAAELS